MPIIQTKRGKIYTFTPEADGEVEVDNLLDPELPTGYTRLAYLQSTGEQYIAIGLSQIGVGLHCSTTAQVTDDYQMVAGSGTAVYDTACLKSFYKIIGFSDNGISLYPLKDGSFANSAMDIQEGDGYIATGKIDVKYNFKKSGLWEYKDDIQSLTFEIAQSDYNHPMALFGHYWNDAGLYATHCWTAPIYWAKFSTGDEIVRDYIPALDPTGKPCMFDKISGSPFYKLEKFTVDFIAGVDTLKQLYSLLAKLPDLTGQTQGTLTIRLDAALQTDELRAMIDERGEAKNWEITEAV